MIDGAERELFTSSLRGVIDRCRGRELDAALVELGWFDAHGDDPRVAASALFEHQGHAGASSSALGWVVAGALGLEAGAAVVLPPFGSQAAPAAAVRDGVEVRGLAIGAPVEAPALHAVVADGRNGTLVELSTVDLDVVPVHGIDPALGLYSVTGHATPQGSRPVDWASAVRGAQLALSHEQIGASRRMLELAREHALERVQFGRPIAAFQAVRHRLADALVAIETAEALVDAAWWVDSAEMAAMAKGQAGRSARIVSRHCQQVLAGIGFTTEHDLHRFVRRVVVLDQLFGSSKSLTRALGEELLRHRRLPDPLPLRSPVGAPLEPRAV